MMTTERIQPTMQFRQKLLEIVKRKQWLRQDQLTAFSNQVREADFEDIWRQLSQPDWLKESDLKALKFLFDYQNRFPGYLLTDYIGSGGMGAVFEARHKKLQRAVALKTLRLDTSRDPKASERFHQEARILAQLQHPKIVSVFDFGDFQGHLFLAMELVKGIDLDELVRREGALSECRAWELVRQVAEGLLYANEKGIVHRDLKPANLILHAYGEDSGEQLKIVDFGLAYARQGSSLASNRLTETGTYLGSPRYMSPEQFTGSTFEPASDIYALGATTFHLLAGKPPFNNMNLSELYAEKLTATAPPHLRDYRANTSQVSCALLSRLMAREPQDRPQGNELLDAIDRTLEVLVNQNVTSETISLPLIRSAAAPVALMDTKVDDELPEPVVLRASLMDGRAWKLWFVSMVILALITLALGYSIWTKRLPPRATSMVEVGWEQSLFDGTNLVGWTRRAGNWIAEPHQYVIEGTNGLLSRLMVLPDSGSNRQRPLDFYRLNLVLQKLDAQYVEIHFGLIKENETVVRHVLRLGGEGFEIGRAQSDQEGVFELSERLHTAMKDFTGPITVRLERHPTGWFVAINDYPAAAIPLNDEHELPMIQFAARQGVSWFSDISLIELKVRD
jgi:serine/threonine protein kinase